MSWQNTFTSTYVPPPSLRGSTHSAIKQEFKRKENPIADVGEWLSGVVSTTRFSLGLPEDNRYTASNLRPMPKDTLRSQKLGDVNEPNPEQRDYFDPAPIPRAEIKEMATGDEFKTCGVGITFTYDLDQEAVVVHRVVVDGPADRSEQIEIGDVLLEVDGLEVDGQPLDVVHSVVRGYEGSPCSLVLWRDGREVHVNLLREGIGEATQYTAPLRCGVGITFETQALDGSARVKTLVRGGGAARCGLIRPGDVLYEVDRTNVFREPLDLVADLLLGDEDTKVRLLFLRGTRTFIETFVTRTSNARQSDMHAILLHAQGFHRVDPNALVAKKRQDEEGEDELDETVEHTSYKQLTRMAIARNQSALPRSMTVIRN